MIRPPTLLLLLSKFLTLASLQPSYAFLTSGTTTTISIPTLRFGVHCHRRRYEHGYYYSTAASSAQQMAFTDGTNGMPPPASPSSSTHNHKNKNDNKDDKSKLSNVSQKTLPPSTLPNGGKITLVGSGPGDPELLTLAAYKLLTGDDVDNQYSTSENGSNESGKTLVVADRLVSQEILDLVHSSGAECKIARKLPGCADAAQEEIYQWCKEGLDEGKHVIRLKIGDPFVFGRGGEEVLTFRHTYHVEPKIIPGVSSTFAAPALGSIPVTHRGVSNQVVMCTGYGKNGTSPDLISYHKEQTIVFLMAVGRLRELSTRLMNMANYPSNTPVGIIQNAGCPNQRMVVGNLDTIADIAEEYQVKAPSTIVVGDVVNVLLEQDNQQPFDSTTSSVVSVGQCQDAVTDG